eukprot:2009209-Pyramimonas_sp.AAC.1
MLQLLGDFLVKNAQPEERRLAGARAKSFRKWIRTSLTTKPGAVHRWTKPKGRQLSTVETVHGVSCYPGDVVSSRRAFWALGRDLGWPRRGPSE